MGKGVQKGGLLVDDDGSRSTGISNSFKGTVGPDLLLGTPYADVIQGLKGDDVLSGLGGNDIVHGDAGNDTIDGGSGDDRLFGDQGDDKITGGAGNDYIDGGPGGTDIAVYSGRYSDYTIRLVSGQAEGTVTYVTDLRDGSPDGFDDLRRIEALQFSDRIFYLDGRNTPAVIGGIAAVALTESDLAQLASGQLTVVDLDSPATFVPITGVLGSGGFGLFSITADGLWTYEMTSAHDEFAAGQDYVDTATVATADGTTQVLTVTIHGTNDAAAISGTSSGAVIEAGGLANSTPGVPAVSGTLVATDVDNAATFTAVSAGAATTAGYGTYAITAGGVWTYTLNETNASVQALNSGQTLTDSFTVTSLDGTPQVVTVTINGTNDAAVIGGAATGSVTEAGGVSNSEPGTPTASGMLTAADVDNPSNLFTAVAAGTASSGGYGTYALTSAGAWTYTLNNSSAAVQALNSGQTLTDGFMVTSADGTSKVVSVTINGANDAAVIGGTTTVLNESNAAQTALGVLTVSDVDSPATFVAQSSAGLFGTFTLDAAGAWTYQMNSAHDEFVGGSEHVDAFTIATVDGTSRQFNVRIFGTNDPTVITGDTQAVLTEGDTALFTEGYLTASDPDGAATAQVRTAVAGTGGFGKFSIDSAGHWTYLLDTPHNEFTAGRDYTDSFTVKTVDGTTRVVSVTIHGTNDSPVAGADALSARQDTAVSVAASTLLSNDVDPDSGDTKTIVSVHDAVNGTAVLAGGVVTFTPAAGFSGTASFTYTMEDGSHSASDGLVTVTVAPAATVPLPLFTNGDDVVDFGAVASGSYVAGTQYDAGAGADVVTAPDSALIAASAGFDVSQTLALGGGNDVVLLHSSATQAGVALSLNGGSGFDELRFFSADATPAGSVIVDLSAGTATTNLGTVDHVVSFEAITVNGTLSAIDDGSATSNAYTSLDGNGSVTYEHAAGPVTVDLAAGTATGAGSDTLSGVVNLVATSSADVLSGSDVRNVIYAGAGNDVVEGRQGDDFLDGGDDFDLASYANAAGAVSVDLAAGTATGADGDDALYNFEGIIGSAFDDILIGDEAANAIVGGAGDDTLTGGDGGDLFSFESGSGHDIITDYLIGTDHLLINGVLVDETNVAAAGITSFLRYTDATAGDSTKLFFVSGDDTVEITLPGVKLPNQPPELMGIGDEGDGKSENDLAGGSYDAVNDVLVLPNGQVLVAGDSGDAQAITRYLAYGLLDGNYGVDGVARAVVSTSEDDVGGIAIVQDALGRIIQVGYGYDDGAYDFAVTRRNADGTVDPSFRDPLSSATYAQGVLTDFDGGEDRAYGVALQRDGRILAGGYSDSDFAIARYNDDGTLDASFGDGGRLRLAIGSSNSGGSVAAQIHGGILFAGTTDGDFALLRLNDNGTFDTGFGSAGVVLTDFGTGSYDEADKLVIQSDGMILVAGGSNGDFAVARYDASGVLDAGFGVGGKVTFDMGLGLYDVARDLVVQSDGRIVVTGMSLDGDYYYFSTARLLANGQLDPSFGNGGKVVTDVGSGDASGVAVQPDGKIVVAGNTAVENANFTVVRYESNGSLDLSFHFQDPQDHPPLYIEGAAPVQLAPNGQVFDLDLGEGSYRGTTLVLERQGGANADDVFSPLGNLAFSSGFVTLGGSIVGSVVENGGGVLKLDFSIADITPTELSAVLRQIGYSNPSYVPPMSVKLDWNFDDGNDGDQGDGGALNTTISTTVLITPTHSELNGTAAADIFILSVTDGADTINGFEHADGDKLDLRDLLIGDVTPSNLGDYVQTAVAGGNTTLLVDVDGQGSAHGLVPIATLTGVTDLLLNQDLLLPA